MIIQFKRFSIFTIKYNASKSLRNIMNNLCQQVKKWKATVSEKPLIDFFRGENTKTSAERVDQRTRNCIFRQVINSI